MAVLFVFPPEQLNYTREGKFIQGLFCIVVLSNGHPKIERVWGSAGSSRSGQGCHGKGPGKSANRQPLTYVCYRYNKYLR